MTEGATNKRQKMDQDWSDIDKQIFEWVDANLDTYIQNTYPILGVFFGSLIIYLFSSSFVFYNKNTQTLIVLILLSALTIFPENKINEELDKKTKYKRSCDESFRVVWSSN